jgi:hypothetical protein
MSDKIWSVEMPYEMLVPIAPLKGAFNSSEPNLKKSFFRGQSTDEITKFALS